MVEGAWTFPLSVHLIAHRVQIVYRWEACMSNAVMERKLLDKGIYVCPSCNRRTEVFVKVVEVACGCKPSRVVMRKVGK